MQACNLPNRIIKRMCTMIKRTILALTAALVGVSSFSQKTLQDWVEMDDAKMSKKWFFSHSLDQIKKNVSSAEDLPSVGNIAVLSYAMFSPNPDPRSDAIIRPMMITGEGTAYLVDELYSYAEPGLQKAFEENGIDYLSNQEFLDTPEKKEKLENTTFELSTLFKATLAMANYFSGRAASGDAKGNPEGQKYIMESGGDAKIWRAVGKFAGEMGVDALLCVEQTVYWDGKNVYLGRIEMSIVGPNPIPENPDHWYAPAGPLKGYLEGLLYAHVELDPPSSYEIGVLKKKEVSFYMDNLDKAYTKIANILVKYMNEEIEKLK